jgi:hypothetical protein
MRNIYSDQTQKEKDQEYRQSQLWNLLYHKRLSEFTLCELGMLLKLFEFEWRYLSKDKMVQYFENKFSK